MPSSMPPPIICSICSVSANWVRTVIRVRAPMGSKVTTPPIEPASGIGSPSAPDGPTENSMRCGLSIESIRHQPWCMKSSGPVIA